jgi:hypothetical protein
MAITELKAHMQTADARRANMHSAERKEVSRTTVLPRWKLNFVCIVKNAFGHET